MKKRYLSIALIFSFIAMGMAFSVGIGFMTQFVDPNRAFEKMSLTATIFTVIAGVITLIAFITGIVSIKKPPAFGAAILSFVSGIILLSCAFTPILHSDGSVFLALALTAGLLEILSGVIYLVYSALFNGKNPLETVLNQNSKAQLKQLKLLESLYNANIINETEFAYKKAIILNNIVNVPQYAESINYSGRKKAVITSIVLSAIVLIYCVVAIPVICVTYKSKIYDYVLDTIGDYNKEYLDNYLDYLPNNYNDTRSIKATYNKVQYNLYHNSDLDSYVELVNIQANDNRWDFKKIFDNIYNFSIENIRWEGEQIYVDLNGGTGIVNPLSYIKFTNNQGNTTFGTNLPTKKESTKSYYFYEKYRSNSIIIGYENQQDKTDSFDAFSISNLKYNSITRIFSIDVFCYSNSKTYTMEYQYS